MESINTESFSAFSPDLLEWRQSLMELSEEIDHLPEHRHLVQEAWSCMATLELIFRKIHSDLEHSEKS